MAQGKELEFHRANMDLIPDSRCNPRVNGDERKDTLKGMVWYSRV